MDLQSAMDSLLASEFAIAYLAETLVVRGTFQVDLFVAASMSAPAPDEKACELLASVQPIVAGKPHLKEFLTPSTLARYLRARNMNVSKASKMLTDTLNWCATCNVARQK